MSNRRLVSVVKHQGRYLVVTIVLFAIWLVGLVLNERELEKQDADSARDWIVKEQSN